MGWLNRLTQGLKKTSQNITSGITEIFTTQKPTAEQLEELEELLILSDMGPTTAHTLCQEVAKTKIEKGSDIVAVQAVLAEKITHILNECPSVDLLQTPHSPSVWMIVGINGSGKTTTIGKLIPWLKHQGKTVRVVAADTFRAAAVEQLKHWCDEQNTPIEIAAPGADPASIAYKGLENAIQHKDDILIIDTAGRLHNKTDLMEELSKIQRVLQKLDPAAPHHGLLVLDATGGQNLLQQVDMFQKYMNVTGFMVTKMDGTAKGGIIIQLAQKYKRLPLFIGVGEDPEDLNPFEAELYARTLVGLEDK